MAAHTDPYNPGERALGGGLVGAGTGTVIGAIAGRGRGAGIGAAAGGGLGAIAGLLRHRRARARHIATITTFITVTTIEPIGG